MFNWQVTQHYSLFMLLRQILYFIWSVCYFRRFGPKYGFWSLRVCNEFARKYCILEKLTSPRRLILLLSVHYSGGLPGLTTRVDWTVSTTRVDWRG